MEVACHHFPIGTEALKKGRQRRTSVQCKGYLDVGVPSICCRASPAGVAGSYLQRSWMNGKKGELILPSVICLIKIKHIFRLLATSLPLPTEANELL